jgi:hypothetical protein
VEVVVDPSQRDAAFPDPEGITRRAAQAWSLAPQAPALVVRAGSAPAGFNPTGANLVSVEFYRQGFPMSTSALAVTVLTMDQQGQRILDADVLVQGSRYRFAWLGLEGLAGGTTAPFDIQATLTHEFGHVLGLGEDPVHPEATMFPRQRPGDLSPRDLSAEDLASIARAYDPNGLPQGGCGGRVTPGATLPWPWASLGVLVLLALGLRRRRAGWLLAGLVLLPVVAPGSAPRVPGVVLHSRTQRHGPWLYTTAVVLRGGRVEYVTRLGGTLGGIRQLVLDAPSGHRLVPGAAVPARSSLGQGTPQSS